VIEAHFGESSPLSLGVEEEVMIVDAETLAQVPAVDVFVREGDGFHTELFASVVELKTGICACARGAEIAARNDLRLCAAGTHPLSEPEEQPIVQKDRYRDFVEYAGVSARRQGVNGLHVHVGMPGPEECLRCLETILPWLPVVLAVSANSPYLAGRETGLASNRAEILAQLPRSGAPPAFGSYGEWETFVERLVDLGFASDYTVLWWDVRPHPRFGTIEVRMPDQPTELSRTAQLIALIQALCAWGLDGAEASHDPAGRGVYQQNRWAALRFGPEARLIHPDGDRAAGAAELAAELVEHVRPYAREQGAEELVAGLDPARSEGERQLEVGRTRGVDAVCADLVERSLP
jgi:carboxylate-amine ligase